MTYKKISQKIILYFRRHVRYRLYERVFINLKFIYHTWNEPMCTLWIFQIQTHIHVHVHNIGNYIVSKLGLKTYAESNVDMHEIIVQLFTVQLLVYGNSFLVHLTLSIDSPAVMWIEGTYPHVHVCVSCD